VINKLTVIQCGLDIIKVILILSAFIRYQEEEDIQLRKENENDFNLWGIHQTETLCELHNTYMQKKKYLNYRCPSRTTFD